METSSGSNRASIADEEVDFFSLCERIAHDIEEVVKRGNLLNERQCRDLSSKILKAVGNIRLIIRRPSGLIIRRPSGLTFTPFLQILYQSLEKAKLLVSECAEDDWIAVAVFQVQNYSSFEEILLKVAFCYEAIYNENAMICPSIRGNILLKDLSSSSWFLPASVSAIESDREDLRGRLKRLASDPSSGKVFGYFLRKQEAQKQCLARYLLQKFSCTSQECLSNSSDVCKASLWKKEIEPPGTWGNSNFLGAGSGASGVCRTQWLGVPCARKEFHGQASEVTFLKEASILSHLKHPRIVNFICCGNGEAKGDRFIAMELMEKSLFDVIEDRKGVHFALPVAVDIILQIAEGISYLHDKGVSHRDLKPQNVVVNRLAFTHLLHQYYSVKLVDFGMSKTKVEVSKSNTISLRGIGTTRYRAPEVHPKAHLDCLGKANWFKVDAYSFAMTCAHVLSLKAPFEDMEQLSELYARLLDGDRPKLPSGLPVELVDIFVECWDVNPQRRPSFVNICTRLCSLYPTILRDYSVEKDYWANKNGTGMRNSRMCSSLATGQTSYYTAQDYSFCGGEDSACDQYFGKRLFAWGMSNSRLPEEWAISQNVGSGDFEYHFETEKMVIAKSEMKTFHPSDAILFKGLTHLRMLFLTSNLNLVSLPSEIGYMKCLEKLDLSWCLGLERLPREIGQLESLEKLNMAGCTSLTEIPAEVGKLQKLVELNMQSCGIKELPVEIGELTRLTYLCLNDCSELRALPEAMGKLSSLENLECVMLQITEIPKALGDLSKLEYVSFAACGAITEIPAEFAKLEKVISFCFAACHRLEAVPNELDQLTNRSLVVFNVSHTRVMIQNLPPSLRELQDRFEGNSRDANDEPEAEEERRASFGLTQITSMVKTEPFLSPRFDMAIRLMYTMANLDGTRHAIVRSGGLPVLLRCIDKGDPDRCGLHAAATVRNICMTYSTHKAVVDAGALSLLTRVLNRKNDIRFYAYQALRLVINGDVVEGDYVFTSEINEWCGHSFWGCERRCIYCVVEQELENPDVKARLKS